METTTKSQIKEQVKKHLQQIPSDIPQDYREVVIELIAERMAEAKDKLNSFTNVQNLLNRLDENTAFVIYYFVVWFLLGNPSADEDCLLNELYKKLTGIRFQK